MSEDDKNQIHFPKKIFNCQEIKKYLHKILHENLSDQQYDEQQCQMLTKNLSNIIKDLLKTLGYDRYKFIIQIYICQQNEDNLQMFCQSYWDSQTDRYAQSIYINQFLICIATAFAIFYY